MIAFYIHESGFFYVKLQNMNMTNMIKMEWSGMIWHWNDTRTQKAVQQFNKCQQKSDKVKSSYIRMYKFATLVKHVLISELYNDNTEVRGKGRMTIQFWSAWLDMWNTTHVFVLKSCKTEGF